VIDEFCAASADGAIDKAARVQTKNVKLLDAARSPDFTVADAELPQGETLTDIFHDSSARRDRLGREYTKAVNSGAANPQAVVRDRRINGAYDFGARTHWESRQSRKMGCRYRVRQPRKPGLGPRKALLLMVPARAQRFLSRNLLPFFQALFCCHGLLPPFESPLRGMQQIL
jgi:hypothetical protein